MIRPFLEGDTDELLAVWLRASRIAHHFLDDDFFAREHEEIAQRWLPIAETVVYEHEGRVVGFLSLVDNEVGAVFVDPQLQGRGIGRALLDWARGQRPVLELNVLEANSSGRRFYRRYGFEEVGRHVNESVGEPEIRLRLE